MNGIAIPALSLASAYCLSVALTACTAETDPAVLPETEMATTGSVIPDGVYRNELTVDELLDAGLALEQATGMSGIQTLTIDDGTFRLNVSNSVSPPDCTGSMVAIEEGTHWTADDEAPCGKPPEATWIELSWRIEGDHLILSDLTAEGGKGETELVAIYTSEPWLILR